MGQKRKLLVIDGNALLHRAFHALPEWRSRNGEATSGVYGFFAMLIKAREELAPSDLIVVFDSPEPNFRHGMYVGYQANRAHDEQLSVDIWGQVEKLKEALESIGVPVYQVSGYEADDIIGTIAVESEKKDGLEVVILTGDRDLLQLVSEKVMVYMPVKGVSEAVLLDRKGVKEKMGVEPEKIVDYKALVGDGSDGYPGVTGIGPKTAIELIDQFGGFDQVYEAMGNKNLAEMVGKRIGEKLKMTEGLWKKLIDGYEMGEMSKRLAKIVTDVPLGEMNQNTEMPNTEKFVQLFERMGHKSLKSRILGEKYEKEKSEEAQGSLF